MPVAKDLRMLYPRLVTGDIGVLGGFADKATVDSPLGGKQQPPEFVTETRSWLDRHDARVEAVNTVETPERVIHELLLCVTVGADDRELPIMLVADVEEDRIRDLRVYHSTWPLTGRHQIRTPLMQYDLTQRPPEPVGTYHAALEAGDPDAADAVFAPEGSVREPAGGPWVYTGEDRTKWYRMVLSTGPIVLHLGTITDDGRTVVYEYMADQWGPDPMTPQAGAAAYQRGPDGRLVSARIYDDVEPPAGLEE